MILVKDKFDCSVIEHLKDEQGRFIVLRGVLQGHQFLFVNIYSPNKTKGQGILFVEIQKELDKLELRENCEVVIGGDFNGTFGKPQVRESCGKIDDLCSSYDLIDIWRIRNPDVIKRFTWRHNEPQQYSAVWTFG